MGTSAFNSPHYFIKPDKSYALEALTKVFSSSDAEEIWADACFKSKSDKDTEECAQLEKIFLTISIQEGIKGVIGHSLLMRLRLYNYLNNR